MVLVNKSSQTYSSTHVDYSIEARKRNRRNTQSGNVVYYSVSRDHSSLGPHHDINLFNLSEPTPKKAPIVAARETQSHFNRIEAPIVAALGKESYPRRTRSDENDQNSVCARVHIHVGIDSSASPRQFESTYFMKNGARPKATKHVGGDGYCAKKRFQNNSLPPVSSKKTLKRSKHSSYRHQFPQFPRHNRNSALDGQVTSESSMSFYQKGDVCNVCQICLSCPTVACI